MTTEEIKSALYARHRNDGVGTEWTVLHEYRNIDVLAMRAWGGEGLRIGYEVKASRSDYRREVLKPEKRYSNVEWCHQFYFAVPKGMLTKEELAYEESPWEDGDFERVKCPAKCRKLYKGERERYRMGNASYAARDRVPVPAVLKIYEPWWMRAGGDVTPSEQEVEYYEKQKVRHLEHAWRDQGWTVVPCPECNGRGYIKGSRVEREAPTLWIPNDVGLIEVSAGGCYTRRKAPKRMDVPTLSAREVTNLVRWASERPDPRHHPWNGYRGLRAGLSPPWENDEGLEVA